MLLAKKGTRPGIGYGEALADAKRPATRERRLAQLPTLVRENRLPGFTPS